MAVSQGQGNFAGTGGFSSGGQERQASQATFAGTGNLGTTALRQNASASFVGSGNLWTAALRQNAQALFQGAGSLHLPIQQFVAALFVGVGRFIARPSTIWAPKKINPILGHPPIALVGRVPISLDQATSAEFTKRLASRVDDALSGRLNTMLAITLAAAGATTTTITDKRIGVTSGLHFTPTSAHAAAILGSIWASAQGNGSVVLNHSVNNQTDCTFNMTIVG